MALYEVEYLPSYILYGEASAGSLTGRFLYCWPRCLMLLLLSVAISDPKGALCEAAWFLEHTSATAQVFLDRAALIAYNRLQAQRECGRVT